MNAKPSSDAELHEMIMTRQAGRSREEWQSLVDAANEAFDHQEAAERAYTRIVSHVKTKAASKRRQNVTEVLVG